MRLWSIHGIARYRPKREREREIELWFATAQVTLRTNDCFPNKDESMRMNDGKMDCFEIYAVILFSQH